MDVKEVVCGSEHTVAIDKETGYPVAWGWNEHGNCTSKQDFVVDPITISQFGEATVIGAGCAASWFGAFKTN
jgi:alpha-tubulin suppressor-like RCC1 family protein